METEIYYCSEERLLKCIVEKGKYKNLHPGCPGEWLFELAMEIEPDIKKLDNGMHPLLVILDISRSGYHLGRYEVQLVD